MSAQATTAGFAVAIRQKATWVQLLKFSIVGGSGYVINLAVFAALISGLNSPHLLAAVGAFCVAVVSNFAWNRYWTFGPGEGRGRAVRFLAVSVASLVVNLVVLDVLVASAGVSEIPAQAIAVAAAMPASFVGNRLWTFT